MNDAKVGREGQVVLLIDFENFVRAVDEEDIDCEAVFRLAVEYGRVPVANAYADWRMKDVNQYQADRNRSLAWEAVRELENHDFFQTLIPYKSNT